MGKFDISGWKDYKITDLFDVKNTHSILSTSVVPNSGTTPYLTAGESNNAISTFIDYDKNLIDKGNCIFIGGKTLVITYQAKDFYSNDSHNLALYIKDEKGKSKNAQLFMVSALYKCLKPLYFWGDSISKKSIQNDFVKLPASRVSGEPDYSYMEKCVEKELAKVRLTLAELKSAKVRREKISCRNWKEFAIGELFEVKKGKRLTKQDMIEGDIRFIGASAADNGITAYIENDNFLHAPNTITVNYNGSVGEAFYQAKEFWASDDVNILYPKFELTKELAMFIIPIIKSVGKTYQFINKWKKEDMEHDKIRLPVNLDGKPDFAFMENHVSELMKKQTRKLECMKEIV